ncbi:MAG: HDOD domain-containing protein [Thermodesulfobacteriota bacterium]|nr:HDOD domain-containing protein [Thermodesulfobacteriota bacterium]
MTHMNAKHLKTIIAMQTAILLMAGFLFIDFFILAGNQRRFVAARQSESWMLSLFVARSLEYNNRNMLAIAPSVAERLGSVFESAGIHATVIMDHQGRLIYVDSSDSELKSRLVIFAKQGIEAGAETTERFGSTWGVFLPAKRYLAINSPITGTNGDVQASVSSVIDLRQFYAAQRRGQVTLILVALAIVVVLTLAGAYAMNRRLADPLQMLIREVDRQKPGERVTTPTGRPFAELIQLVDVFNRLLSRIEKENLKGAAPSPSPLPPPQTVDTVERPVEEKVVEEKVVEEKIRVTCDGCGKSYRIAASKLGGRASVVIPCPACSHKIKVVRNTSPDAEKNSPPSPAPQASTPSKERKKPADPADYTFIDERFVAPADGEALRRKILESSTYLPPMPQVVYKARQVFASPDSSFKDISETLEMDQAIASRVLRMANSAYYGMQGQVSSIHQASVLLGIRTLGELITVAGAAQLLEKKLNGYDFSSGLLWRHSLAVAHSAEKIAEKIAPEIKDDAFFAGLIHDAGKLVLDPYMLEQKEAVENFLEYKEKTFLAAERQVLGLDHAQVGYDLCLQWNIPDVQAGGIKYHHNPVESDDNTLAYILHMSDWIAMAAGFGADFQALMHQMDSQAMDILGLAKEDTDDIQEKVKAYVASVSKEMQAG